MGWGSEYFVPTDSQPRVRRIADALTAIIGLLLTAFGIAGIDRLPPWEEALEAAVAACPSWMLALIDVVFSLGLLYGLGVVLVLMFGGSERRPALRDVVVSIVVSLGLAYLLAWVYVGEWPNVLPELAGSDPDPRFPVVRVVVVTAVLIASAPHLARPMRRLGWLILFTTGIAAVTLGLGDPSDAMGAVGIGMMVGGIWLLIVGSPRGYPNPDSVSGALRALGVTISEVSIDPDQSWGTRRLVATTEDGTLLEIKAYGRDAVDSARLAKVWRTMFYRESGRIASYSRLQAVEHEALLTMLAGQAGVDVPTIVAAGQSSSEIALLALVRKGSVLEDAEAADVDDETIVAVWRDVVAMHDASISHGSLTTSAIRLTAGGHVITDFSVGSVVPNESDQLLDIVEFLASVSILIGPERAVTTAARGLGSERLTDALPYIQLPAISRGTRKQMSSGKAMVAELQDAVVEATGSELPEPVKLKRISGKQALNIGLLLFFVWAVIPLLTSVDYAEVWGVLEDATWSLMVIALLLGQTMFITLALSTRFAVSVRIPFSPLVVLQIAVQYIGLAIPSMAGRVALSSAFLHKFGLSLTLAVTQGAMDSFAGFIVQAVILVLAVIFGGIASGADIDTSDVQWGLVILVVVVLCVATVVAVLKIKKLHDKVVPVVREAWQALVELTKSPTRAIGLLGANLLTDLIVAGVLWLVLEAVGAPLNLMSCLVIITGASLLQGIVPIPGGIGVTEGVMTSFLVAAGIDQSVAFAAVVVYRAITFYLPAAEGFFAMNWLEKNEYL